MLSSLVECGHLVFLALISVVMLCVCVWHFLSLCSCFWRSLGWASDCCTLLWQCSIEPKAFWLPLQVTLSMATFHSQLFTHLNLAYTFKIFKSIFHLIVKLRYKKLRYMKWLYWIHKIRKCVCQITPYVSVVGLVCFLEVWYSDVSGVDTALSSYASPSLHVFKHRLT